MGIDDSSDYDGQENFDDDDFDDAEGDADGDSDVGVDDGGADNGAGGTAGSENAASGAGANSSRVVEEDRPGGADDHFGLTDQEREDLEALYGTNVVDPNVVDDFVELYPEEMAAPLVAVLPYLQTKAVNRPGFQGHTYDWRRIVGKENSWPINTLADVVTLDEAMNREWGRDAMMLTYVVKHRATNRWLKRMPRVAKNAVLWFESIGYDIYTTVIALDVDTEDHLAWSDKEQEKFERLRRECPSLSTGRIYRTEKGWRFVVVFTEPVPWRLAEAVTKSYYAQWEKEGIPVDWRCADWTHVFRPPNTLRQGKDGSWYRSAFPVENAENANPVFPYDPVIYAPPTLPNMDSAHEPMSRGDGQDGQDDQEGRGEQGEQDEHDTSDGGSWQGDTKSKRQRASRASGLREDTEIPKHLDILVEILSRAVYEHVTSQYHDAYMYLSGALISRCKIPYVFVPETVRRIAIRAEALWRADFPTDSRTWVEQHVRSAQDTCSRHAEGMAVGGLPKLRAQYPALANAVEYAMNRSRLQEDLLKGKNIYPIKRARDELRKTIVGAGDLDAVTLVKAGCGIGKALGLDTPIPTPSGWTTMGGISVGDRVFDERGRICRVTFVTDVMLGRACYEVVFDDGTVVVADGEHQWLTTTRVERRRLASCPAYRARSMVVTTDEIRTSLRHALSKACSEANHAIQTADPIDVAEADLDVDPRAFGIWRFIVDVRQTKSVPVKCIMVDSPSHLYVVTESMIPTHNTHAAEEAAIMRADSAPEGARAPRGSKTAISVDKNRLASQVKKHIEAKGAQVKRYRSPISVHEVDPVTGFDTGVPVCKFHASGKALQEGGHSVPLELCEGRGKNPCPHKGSCKAYGSYEGDEGARIFVGNHATIKQLMREVGATGMLVIDEPPPLITTNEITAKDVEIARRSAHVFDNRYHGAMLPALLAMAKVIGETPLTEYDDPLPRSQPFEGAFMDAANQLAEDVVSTGCSHAGIRCDGSESLAWYVMECAARALPEDRRGDAPMVRTSEMLRARSNSDLAATIGRASKVLVFLRDALTRFRENYELTKQAVRVEERLVTRGVTERVAYVTSVNVDFVQLLKEPGAKVITDANMDIHVPVYQRVLSETDKPFVGEITHIEALDGARVDRYVAPMPYSTRSGWMINGSLEWQMVVKAVRRAINFVQKDEVCGFLGKKVGDRKLCIISFKKLTIALRATRSPDSKKIRRAWIESGGTDEELDEGISRLRGPLVEGWGGKMVIGYFGGLRGMDDVMDSDTIITMGDAWSNLGAVRAEVSFLNSFSTLDADGNQLPKIDFNERARALCQAELEQAHGRTRTPDRTAPCLALHVGATVPGGMLWSSQDVHYVEVPTDDFPEPMASDELVDIRTRLGMNHPYAAYRLGVSERTLKKYESGEVKIPMAVAIRARNLLQDL